MENFHSIKEYKQILKIGGVMVKVVAVNGKRWCCMEERGDMRISYGSGESIQWKLSRELSMRAFKPFTSGEFFQMLKVVGE